MLDKIRLKVECEQEQETGRWIADVTDLPGVMVYGSTRTEAMNKAKLLALDVVIDRLAHGEDPLTGCEMGEACPAVDVLAEFRGLEFDYAVAC